VPKDAQYAIALEGDALRVTPAEGDVSVVWTLVPADVEAIENGTLDLNVAFMQGRAKAAGDGRALLEFLTRTQSLRSR
jgi:hypothetical protein